MHNSDEILGKLKKKGWSEEELHHAGLIFSQHHNKHHILHHKYDKYVHWIVFTLIILTNIFTFLFLIPIFLIEKTIIVYSLVAVIAVIFGLSYNVIIQNMTHLEKKHHLVFTTLIPILAIISFFIFFGYIQTTFSATIQHPLGISIIYTIFLLIPYYLKQAQKYYTSL